MIVGCWEEWMFGGQQELWVRLTSLLPSRLAVGKRKTKVPARSSWLIIDE